MWTWTVLAVVAIVSCAGLFAGVRASVLANRQHRETIRAFLDSPREIRAERMQALLDRDCANATAWYLLGCARLAEYRTTEAARAFGMAHHRDCGLKVAAMLTFACLKAADGRDSDVIDQWVDTWQEMKQPDVMDTAQDRRMFESLAAAEQPPPTASSLGRLIWLAVGPEHRTKMRHMLASTDPRWGPLRRS